MPDDDFFKKNVERWAAFCPAEAASLSSIDDKELPEIDRELTSPEEFLREAQESVRLVGLKGVDVLYAYGVGAGSMYDAVGEWLKESPSHQLVFLEPDMRVIKRLLRTAKGSRILNDRQVWLYFLDSEGAMLESLTTTFVLKPWRLVVVPQYAGKDEEVFHQFRSKLTFFSNLMQMSVYEYVHFGWGYFQNFFRNILQLPDARPASQLYGRFRGVPAIICGAGPSLKKNLHLLEGLKDRALIFAGGTAMNAINAQGVVPHFGIGIDPNLDQVTRLITNIAFETPYFYRNRLQHEGLTLIHGEKLYVAGSGGYGITLWLEEQLGIKAKDLAEGCNVINFSLSIAGEMGCNPIIFVGVDLAYSDEEPYAPGVVNHPIHSRRAYFKTKNAEEELIVKPDIYGKGVYTLWKWVMESCWFTTFATHNPSLQLINATEGGLGFARIPNMTLQEAADKYLVNSYDFAGLVHTEIQRSKMPPQVTRQTIDSLMDVIGKSLDKCSEAIKTISNEIKKVAEEHQQGKEIPEDFWTEKAKEQMKLLEDEPAYAHFLKVFDEAFTRYTEGDNTRLGIDAELIGSAAVKEEKLKLLVRRYQYLASTAAANAKHLRETLGQTVERTQQLESMEASYHPSAAPVSTFSESPYDHPEGSGIIHHEQKGEKGKVIAKYTTRDGLLHGLFIHYGADGREASKTLFLNGLREGEAHDYYPSGSLAAIRTYSNGAMDGRQRYYYSDGTLKAEIDYSKGSLHGHVDLYNRFGRPCRQLVFEKGKRHGIERIWNDEGLLAVEAEFREDRPAGRARKWYGNGNLALEIIYDDSGLAMSTRKWDRMGVPLEETEDTKDDYFDQVTRQTGILTLSLEDVVKQVSTVLPILANTLGGEEAKECAILEDEVVRLKEQMEQLKEINKQLVREAGLDPADHKEPLWKSPSSRRELELKVEEHANKMAQELSAVQISLARTLQDLARKMGDGGGKPEGEKQKTE